MKGVDLVRRVAADEVQNDEFAPRVPLEPGRRYADNARAVDEEVLASEGACGDFIAGPLAEHLGELNVTSYCWRWCSALAVERVCRWLLEAVGEVRGSWLTGDDGGKRTRGKCRIAHFC